MPKSWKIQQQKNPRLTKENNKMTKKQCKNEQQQPFKFSFPRNTPKNPFAKGEWKGIISEWKKWNHKLGVKNSSKIKTNKNLKGDYSKKSKTDRRPSKSILFHCPNQNLKKRLQLRTMTGLKASLTQFQKCVSNRKEIHIIHVGR